MAVSGAAQAEPEFKIYGRLDVGLKRAPENLASADKLQSTVDDSSRGRLGYLGSEDLGGGTKAFFQLEHRFDTTAGAQDGAVFWKDKAWVGLSNDAVGTLRLGRMSSPQDWVGVAGRYEAFFGDSYASNGTRGAKSAAKWDQTAYYESPSWGGLNLGLALQAAPAGRKDARGLHLGYANGPLSFMLTHQVEQDPTSGASASDGIKTFTLGGFYDFGVVKPMFTYARSTDLAANDQGREVVWTVGARIPAGPGEVRLSYRRISDDKVNGSSRAGDRESGRLGMGYHYPLSKRTSINLSLVREQVKTYEAGGALKSSRAGWGYETALRHNF
jgi:predicted porin